MIERHGPELKRAHLFLRPFYYADKTDVKSAAQATVEAARRGRLDRAAKYASGIVLCMTMSQAYDKAKEVASLAIGKKIIGIGGETMVTLQQEGGQDTDVDQRVRKYATRVRPVELPGIRDELQRRFEIGKEIMGHLLLDTAFGTGIHKKTDQPTSVIMDQPYIPELLCDDHPKTDSESVALIREGAEKLLVDHGLVADINAANGNIRRANDGSVALVDVSFASIDDKHQLLAPTQLPMLDSHIARIQAVSNTDAFRYNVS